jgi:hypothetical protein
LITGVERPQTSRVREMMTMLEERKKVSRDEEAFERKDKFRKIEKKNCGGEGFLKTLYRPSTVVVEPHPPPPPNLNFVH